MADYRCPNCSGYRSCDNDCPTGGVAALALNALYKRTLTALEEYWAKRRLLMVQPTLSELRGVIDQSWQDEHQTLTRKAAKPLTRCGCSQDKPHTDGKLRLGMHWSDR